MLSSPTQRGKEVSSRRRKDGNSYKTCIKGTCTCKTCKTTVFIVKYANLWRSCRRRRRGCLSSLINDRMRDVLFAGCCTFTRWLVLHLWCFLWDWVVELYFLMIANCNKCCTWYKAMIHKHHVNKCKSYHFSQLHFVLLQMFLCIKELWFIHFIIIIIIVIIVIILLLLLSFVFEISRSMSFSVNVII